MLRRAPAALPALAWALALVLAVALGGCGDGGLSESELRAQAAAICIDTATAMDLIAVPDTADRGERFLSAGAAQLRPALARLRRLDAPGSLRTGYAQALQLGGEELALIAGHARAIRHSADVVATFRGLRQRLGSLTQAEDAAWRALGIPACVRR